MHQRGQKQASCLRSSMVTLQYIRHLCTGTSALHVLPLTISEGHLNLRDRSSSGIWKSVGSVLNTLTHTCTFTHTQHTQHTHAHTPQLSAAVHVPLQPRAAAAAGEASPAGTTVGYCLQAHEKQ